MPPYSNRGVDYKELSRAGWVTQNIGQYARVLIWEYPDSQKFESWLCKEHVKTAFNDLHALGKWLKTIFDKHYMSKIDMHRPVYEAATYAADMVNLFIAKEHDNYCRYLKALNKDNPGVTDEF